MTESLSKSELSELCARVLEGETAAFEPIVFCFEARVRAYLALRALPGIDVDDIAQRCFFAAYEGLERFEAESDFESWILSIAHFQLRTATTRLRRLASYRRRWAPEFLRREMERQAFSDSDNECRRLESLRACLGTLPAPERRFLTWRYEDERPLSEIADHSGRSVGAIKKKLWKLRRALQRCVEARLATEGRTA